MSKQTSMQTSIINQVNIPNFGGKTLKLDQTMTVKYSEKAKLDSKDAKLIAPSEELFSFKDSNGKIIAALEKQDDSYIVKIKDDTFKAESFTKVKSVKGYRSFPLTGTDKNAEKPVSLSAANNSISVTIEDKTYTFTIGAVGATWKDSNENKVDKFTPATDELGNTTILHPTISTQFIDMMLSPSQKIVKATTPNSKEIALKQQLTQLSLMKSQLTLENESKGLANEFAISKSFYEKEDFSAVLKINNLPYTFIRQNDKIYFCQKDNDGKKAAQWGILQDIQILNVKDKKDKENNGVYLFLGTNNSKTVTYQAIKLADEGNSVSAELAEAIINLENNLPDKFFKEKNPSNAIAYLPCDIRKLGEGMETKERESAFHDFFTNAASDARSSSILNSIGKASGIEFTINAADEEEVAAAEVPNDAFAFSAGGLTDEQYNEIIKRLDNISSNTGDTSIYLMQTIQNIKNNRGISAEEAQKMLDDLQFNISTHMAVNSSETNSRIDETNRQLGEISEMLAKFIVSGGRDGRDGRDGDAGAGPDGAGFTAPPTPPTAGAPIGGDSAPKPAAKPAPASLTQENKHSGAAQDLQGISESKPTALKKVKKEAVKFSDTIGNIAIWIGLIIALVSAVTPFGIVGAVIGLAISASGQVWNLNLDRINSFTNTAREFFIDPLEKLQRENEKAQEAFNENLKEINKEAQNFDIIRDEIANENDPLMSQFVESAINQGLFVGISSVDEFYSPENHELRKAMQEELEAINADGISPEDKEKLQQAFLQKYIGYDTLRINSEECLAELEAIDFKNFANITAFVDKYYPETYTSDAKALIVDEIKTTFKPHIIEIQKIKNEFQTKEIKAKAEMETAKEKFSTTQAQQISKDYSISAAFKEKEFDSEKLKDLLSEFISDEEKIKSIVSDVEDKYKLFKKKTSKSMTEKMKASLKEEANKSIIDGIATEIKDKLQDLDINDSEMVDDFIKKFSTKKSVLAKTNLNDAIFKPYQTSLSEVEKLKLDYKKEVEKQEQWLSTLFGKQSVLPRLDAKKGLNDLANIDYSKTANISAYVTKYFPSLKGEKRQMIVDQIWNDLRTKTGDEKADAEKKFICKYFNNESLKEEEFNEIEKSMTAALEMPESTDDEKAAKEAEIEKVNKAREDWIVTYHGSRTAADKTALWNAFQEIDAERAKIDFEIETAKINKKQADASLKFALENEKNVDAALGDAQKEFENAEAAYTAATAKDSKANLIEKAQLRKAYVDAQENFNKANEAKKTASALVANAQKAADDAAAIETSWKSDGTKRTAAENALKEKQEKLKTQYSTDFKQVLESVTSLDKLKRLNTIQDEKIRVENKIKKAIVNGNELNIRSFFIKDMKEEQIITKLQTFGEALYSHYAFSEGDLSLHFSNLMKMLPKSTHQTFLDVMKKAEEKFDAKEEAIKKLAQKEKKTERDAREKISVIDAFCVIESISNFKGKKDLKLLPHLPKEVEEKLLNDFKDGTITSPIRYRVQLLAHLKNLDPKEYPNFVETVKALEDRNLLSLDGAKTLKEEFEKARDEKRKEIEAEREKKISATAPKEFVDNVFNKYGDKERSKVRKEQDKKAAEEKKNKQLEIVKKAKDKLIKKNKNINKKTSEEEKADELLIELQGLDYEDKKELQAIFGCSIKEILKYRDKKSALLKLRSMRKIKKMLSKRKVNKLIKKQEKEAKKKAKAEEKKKAILPVENKINKRERKLKKKQEIRKLLNKEQEKIKQQTKMGATEYESPAERTAAAAAASAAPANDSHNPESGRE